MHWVDSGQQPIQRFRRNHMQVNPRNVGVYHVSQAKHLEIERAAARQLELDRHQNAGHLATATVALKQSL